MPVVAGGRRSAAATGLALALWACRSAAVPNSTIPISGAGWLALRPPVAGEPPRDVCHIKISAHISLGALCRVSHSASVDSTL
eukprot:SAG25_NODE_914_length_4782_cov_18.583600_8_plen_83_part_00